MANGADTEALITGKGHFLTGRHSRLVDTDLVATYEVALLANLNEKYGSLVRSIENADVHTLCLYQLPSIC